MCGLAEGLVEGGRGKRRGALSGAFFGSQRSGLLARKGLYYNTGSVFFIESSNVCCRLSVVLNNDFFRGQLERECFSQGPLGTRGAPK